MIHTEVLDGLLKRGEAPKVEVPEPFFKDEDFQNMQIVDGGP